MAENWIPETRNRLAQRRAKKPDTKAGQIWALWPEIRAALDDGQSFRSVCQWLQEDAGIAVSIPSLRSYISRSRRKEAALRKAEAAALFLRAAGSNEHRTITDANPVRPSTLKDGTGSTSPDRSPLSGDPMAGAKRALNNSGFDVRKIHGDGDPTGKNLI